MTEMTVTGKPPVSPDEQCTLPATNAWGVYPSVRSRDVSTLRLFPFCRFHEQPVRAVADTYCGQQTAGHYVHRDSYPNGQSLVRCTGQANPPQLGGILDAERILSLQQDVRTALARLTALTTNAVGVSAYVGNEDAVLEAFEELGDDLDREADVVRSRRRMREDVVPTDRLTHAAKETLRGSGIAPAAWLRAHPHCDRCGCSDDRCMDGFHHDPDEECGCLPVRIGDYQLAEVPSC